MGQLGHPYASQVKASQRRRLQRLGAHAGKSWGRASMDQKSSYPKTNAGTEREMTISGKSAGKRVDRYARGGHVKGKHTTNVVVAIGKHGNEDQGRPVPVPVPVGGPGGPPVAAPPMRPPMAPPAGLGRPPVAGMRPPGMKRGGHVKKASGGFLKESPGRTYRGSPHSPTTSVDDAVSASKRGGAVKRAKGGAVFKAGSGTGYSRERRNKEAAKIPAKTEV